MRALLALGVIVAVLLPAPAGAAPLLAFDRPLNGVAASGADVLALVGCRHLTVIRANGTHRHEVLGGSCGGGVQFSAGPVVTDGTRAAWLSTSGGNNRTSFVWATARLRSTGATAVQSVGLTDGGGGFLSGLGGGAGLIAWAITSEVRDPPSDDCSFGCLTGYRTDVRRLDGRRARRVATIDATASVLAASGRRVVVRVADELQVRDLAGTVVASVVAPDAVAAAVLGDRVLLLRRDRIEWLAADGSVAEVLPLTGRGRPGAFLAARGRYVVYTDTGRVHVVRLADGVDRVIARAPAGPVAGSGLVGVALGSAGAVYGRNRGCRAVGDCRGEVRLVGNATIARALGPVEAERAGDR